MIFHPYTQFIETYSFDLNDETWYHQVAQQLIQAYSQTLSRMLTSVRQIEESLKRFSKTKQLSFGPSDEDKIRLQVQIDIDEFNTILKNLNFMDVSVDSCLQLDKQPEQNAIEI